MNTEPKLLAALEDTARHPGGMVRAHLAFEGGLAAGLAESAALRLACAIEYFHTASLLLDDLPSMDDAEERRGRPCAHRVHGEATAILAALALINRAHTLAGTAFLHLPADTRMAAQLGIDAWLGTPGLLNGQARDLEFSNRPGDAGSVARIARLKTGTLFEIVLQLPALTGPMTAREWSILRRLCLYWGLAYQAADDLVDVLAHRAEAGKTTGRDRARCRPNLALCLGVPATRRRLVRLIAQAAQSVDRLLAVDSRWAYLRRYQDLMARRVAPVAVVAA